MIHTIQQFIFPAAFALLPMEMDSREAGVMLLAIGLQESKFTHRTQLESGPARGFWQFELGGGTLEVLSNRTTQKAAYDVLAGLSYHATPPDNRHSGDDSRMVHSAIAHNDVLACCFARLLLWRDPKPLPTTRDQVEYSWAYYTRTWRPGRPHKEAWEGNYQQAWDLIHCPMGEGK